MHSSVALGRHAPVAGVAAAFLLFALAAHRYPGGTLESATTLGYSFTHNFVSSLFAVRALNGAPNTARGPAVAAMLAFCVSLSFIFATIARQAPTAAHARAIRIGGIGTAVYGFLVVTPMHDLMVTFSLAFSLVAMLATIRALYVTQRWLLTFWGASGLALTLLVAAMYYGHTRYDLLPAAQKAGLIVSVSWLLAAYYNSVSSRPSTRDAAA